jgi:hypothetical protein
MNKTKIAKTRGDDTVKRLERRRSARECAKLDPSFEKAMAEEGLTALLKRKYIKTVKKEDMRKEYRREDLGIGVRGKYYDEFRKGTNLVLLSPDVAKAFPTEEAVNKALRSLINIAQETIGLTKHSSRHAKTARG